MGGASHHGHHWRLWPGPFRDPVICRRSIAVRRLAAGGQGSASGGLWHAGTTRSRAGQGNLMGSAINRLVSHD